jgi:hypothetical protein
MPGRLRRGSEAYERYARFSQGPMTALAFLMVPVLLIPLIRPVHGAVAACMDAADYAIWALFGLDYCVRFCLAASPGGPGHRGAAVPAAAARAAGAARAG